MKKFIGLIILSVLLFSQSVFADEEFTVWTSQTFIPQGGNPTFGDRAIIATSPEILNPNDYSSLDIVIRYELFNPDAADALTSYKVYAIIECGMLNEWFPVHFDSEGIDSFDDAFHRILTIVPDYSLARGTVNNYEVGTPSQKFSRIYVVSGHLTSKFRIRIIYSDPTEEHSLASIRISAFGRKFGREFVPAGQP